MGFAGRLGVFSIFLLIFYSLIGLSCTNLVKKIKRDVQVSSYTHYKELKETLLSLEVDHPNLAKVGNIGKSVQGKKKAAVVTVDRSLCVFNLCAPVSSPSSDVVDLAPPPLSNSKRGYIHA